MTNRPFYLRWALAWGYALVLLLTQVGQLQAVVQLEQDQTGGEPLHAFRQPAEAEIFQHLTVAKQMTAKLLAHGSGLEAQAARVQRSLVDVAQQRKTALLALMELAPEEVLRLILPAEVRANLPAEVQPYLERDLQTDGVLEAIVEDWPDRAITRYTLVDDSERLNLHFVGRSPTLLSGARVRIQGLRLDQEVVLTSSMPNTDQADTGQTDMEVLAAAPPPETLGEQRAVVILVNFQDNSAEPINPLDAQDLLFGQVSAYYSENSYQQTWLTGAVVGWYSLPISVAGSCNSNLNNITVEAIKAADPDVYFPDFNRIVIMFPYMTCGWWGRGTLGLNTVDTADGLVSASIAWINGLSTMGNLAHELGHNFGLRHANALECGPMPLGQSGCISIEYGDQLDVMGSASSNGHFNAAHKDALGWFAPANVATLDSPGSSTYTLAPLEVSSGQIQTIRIFKGVDPTVGGLAWYYIEYRQPLGFDAGLEGSEAISGAQIRLVPDWRSGKTLFLDTTPQTRQDPDMATNDFMDGTLAVGKTFMDLSGIMISPLEATASGLTVQVTVLPDTEVPEVRLASPAPGEAIKSVEGSVPITGTASGAGSAFQHYELYYGQGIAPDRTTWVLIDGPVTAPVTEGALATWAIDGLTMAPYLLKLAVVTAGGLRFEETIELALEPNAFMRISPDFLAAYSPDIFQESIVYHHGGGGWWDISHHDLDTNTTRQLTSNPAAQLRPKIHGARVVYEDWTSGHPHIALYDLTTETERQVTTVASNQIRPAIAGDLVIWHDDRNGKYDVYLHDLATNTERLLSTTPPDAHTQNLAISESRAVWEIVSVVNDLLNVDIYLYDLVLGAGRQITSSSAYQTHPDISEDWIVWEDARNGNLDIYLYDITRGVERQLTTDPAHQRRPKIDGNRVVWEDARYGNWDIFYYDVAADTERQVTSHPAKQLMPAISGNRIVWHDWRDGYAVIYLYDLLSTPPVLEPIGDKTVAAGELLTFVVTASDPDDDTLTLGASGLPEGSQFIDQSNGTGTFTWTPTNEQAGTHRVTFAVSDGRQLSDSETISIRVTSKVQFGGTIISDPDSLPVQGVEVRVEQASDYSFVETVTTDAEGIYVTSFLPEGEYVLTASKPHWEFWPESYRVDTRPWPSVDFLAFWVNDPPVLHPMGDKAVHEGQLSSFTVSASDSENDPLTFEATPVPPGASLVPLGDVTLNGDLDATDAMFLTQYLSGERTLSPEQLAVADVDENGLIEQADADRILNLVTGLEAPLNKYRFVWTPQVGQAGSYPITFTVSDGSLSDSETITITVRELPPPPSPTGLVAEAVSTDQINLTWTDVVLEDRYELDRSSRWDFGRGVTTLTVERDLTTYADTGLKAGKTYYYRLRACNAVGCSAYSTTATATTLNDGGGGGNGGGGKKK